MKNTTLLISTITLCFLQFHVFAQTSVPAIISTDQVWDAAGSPYQITQNTFIDTGVSVKVMPGASMESMAGSFYLVVQGELQLLGSVNSRISVDNLELSFSPYATPYNTSDESGCQIKYADIENFGNRVRAVRCSNQSFLMENTTIATGRVAFEANYQLMDSSFLYINNCKFLGTPTNDRRIFLVANTRRKFDIRNCEFRNASSVDILGSGLFIKNELHNLVLARIHSYGNVEAQCNLFSQLRNGLEVASLDGNIDFSNNTIDSSGHISGNSIFPMMFITTDSVMLQNVNSIKFRNNNYRSV